MLGALEGVPKGSQGSNRAAAGHHKEREREREREAAAGQTKQPKSHSSSWEAVEELAGACKACWAEARVKIARMTLTIKLDGNWSSFQLANSAPPLSVTDSAIAPSARI